MAEEQHEGVFPRLNADLLKKGLGDGQIVSVVGTIQSNDGQNASITCADGDIVHLSVSPDFDGQPVGSSYLNFIINWSICETFLINLSLKCFLTWLIGKSV